MNDSVSVVNPHPDDDAIDIVVRLRCQSPYLNGSSAELLMNEAADEINRLRGPVDWAVERWNAEVKNRPMQNIHRRALDTTWRQVIRHFGGDDKMLCGPRHDELVP
jgi:hypothetical protein